MTASWPLTTNLLYLFATLLIVSDTRLRFDRIAGRMTEGRMAVAPDRMIHGDQVAPGFLGEEEVPESHEEPGSPTASEHVSEPV